MRVLWTGYEKQIIVYEMLRWGFHTTVQWRFAVNPISNGGNVDVHCVCCWHLAKTPDLSLWSAPMAASRYLKFPVFKIFDLYWLVVSTYLWKIIWVGWGYELPNWMESHKIPWFQSPPTSLSFYFCLPFGNQVLSRGLAVTGDPAFAQLSLSAQPWRTSKTSFRDSISWRFHRSHTHCHFRPWPWPKKTSQIFHDIPILSQISAFLCMYAMWHCGFSHARFDSLLPPLGHSCFRFSIFSSLVITGFIHCPLSSWLRRSSCSIFQFLHVQNDNSMIRWNQPGDAIKTSLLWDLTGHILSTGELCLLKVLCGGFQSLQSWNCRNIFYKSSANFL